MNNETTSVKPAWKHPWFLFVVGLPLIVVIACFVTMYLAFTTDDGVVSDDYYKEGLAINQDLRRDDKAQEYGLNGQLTLTGDIAELRLQGNAKAALAGQPIQLFLQNMGVPAQDQRLTLVPTGEANVWRTTLKETPPKGLWLVRVETPEWRLMTKINGVLDQVIVLK